MAKRHTRRAGIRHRPMLADKLAPGASARGRITFHKPDGSYERSQYGVLAQLLAERKRQERELEASMAQARAIYSRILAKRDYGIVA